MLSLMVPVTMGTVSSQYVAIMTDLLLEMSTWELAEVLFTDRLESEAQEEEEEEVMEEEVRVCVCVRDSDAVLV